MNKELLDLVIEEDLENLRIAIYNYSNGRIPLKQVIDLLDTVKTNLKGV